MSLFPSDPMRRARPVPTLYEFIRDEESTDVRPVRALLEGWFRHVPPVEAEAWLGRFRSDDARAALAAFWELWLHEAYLLLGYDIAWHPELPDSHGTPDFLVSRGDASFYLEATALADSDTVWREERRRDAVRRLLSRLEASRFVLRLRISAMGEQTPSAERVIPRVQRWLSGLDADAARVAYETDGRSAPSARFEFAGWVIHLTAIPLPPNASVADVLITEVGVGARSGFSDPQAVRGKLLAKARRYGHPDRPLVIALAGLTTFQSHWAVEQALFGNEAVQLLLDEGGDVVETRPTRSTDGYWLRGDRIAGQRVSAVLGAMHVGPWNLRQLPVCWLNPWATHPAKDVGPWETKSVDLDTDRFVSTQATVSADKLFRFD